MNTTRDSTALGTTDGELYGKALFARGLRAEVTFTGCLYHKIAIGAWRASDAGLTYAARSEYVAAFRQSVHITLGSLGA
jgi:hypothetical protein